MHTILNGKHWQKCRRFEKCVDPVGNISGARFEGGPTVSSVQFMSQELSRAGIERSRSGRDTNDLFIANSTCM